MAKEATGRYTIKSTLIVPEDVVKLKDGQTVATGQTVSLPVSYGDHLVADLLAVKAAEGKTRADKAAAEKAAAEKREAEAKAAVEAAEKVLAEADGDEEKAAAQKAFDEALTAYKALTV